MVLIEYGIDLSPPARSVDLLANTLGLHHQYKTVNLWEQEHLQPEFLKVSPLHIVPAIDDDGFILWESRAIMTYLVSKYGKDDSLYPKDLKKRAIVDQRLHYSNDCFYVLKYIVRRLLWEDHKPDEEWIGRSRECLENVEKLLEGNKFMAGDTLTVADFSFITILDILQIFCPPKEQFPLTKLWQERCKNSMVNFDKVNTPGATKIKGDIITKLNK